MQAVTTIGLDIAKRLTDVRSTAKSGHRVRVPACPLSATSGLLGLLRTDSARKQRAARGRGEGQ